MAGPYLNRIAGIGYMFVQLQPAAWEVRTQGGGTVIVQEGVCTYCVSGACRHARALRTTLAREDDVMLALAQDSNPPVVIGSDLNPMVPALETNRPLTADTRGGTC